MRACRPACMCECLGVLHACKYACMYVGHVISNQTCMYASTHSYLLIMRVCAYVLEMTAAYPQ